jgi:hypothetical protein
MRVHIIQLYEAMRKLAWRHGVVSPAAFAIRSTSTAATPSRFSLKGDEVEYMPPSYAKATLMGATTPPAKK